MATVGDIERIKALAERLLPLTTRARGEVIASDDWNTVVQSLLEIARATVATGPDQPVQPHQHLDQVSDAWLSAKLRDLLERGPLSDPVATSRLTSLERRADLGLQQLDQLTAQIRELRVTTGRHEGNDLERAVTLDNLTRKLDGLSDPRDDITNLRKTLDAIGTNISSVSTFAAGLGDVTPQALLDGLKSVGDVRQRLTLPTGELLDAGEVARQVTELKTTLVTQDQLTEALQNVNPKLSPAVTKGIIDEARVAAQQQAETSAGSLTEQLRAQLSGRIDGLQQTLVQAARDAADQFRDDVQAQVTETLRGVIADGDSAVRASVQQAIDKAGTLLQASVDQRVTQIESSLSERVGAALDSARPDLMAGLTKAIDDRLIALDARFQQLTDGLGEVRSALNGATTDLATLKQSTATALDARIASLRAEFATTLGTALNDLRSAQAKGFDALRAEIAAERSRVNDEIASVRTAVTSIQPGIRRDELDAALAASNTQLRSDILKQVDTRFEREAPGGVIRTDTTTIPRPSPVRPPIPPA